MGKYLKRTEPKGDHALWDVGGVRGVRTLPCSEITTQGY